MVGQPFPPVPAAPLPAAGSDVSEELPAAPGTPGRTVRLLGLDLPLPSMSDPSLIERRIAKLRWPLLLAAVLIPFCGLMPELIHLTPDVNDSAFHLGVARNTIEAVGERANPLDFWIPTWLCGYPLFHYYQPGPYLLLAALYFGLFKLVPLLTLYRLTTILAVSAFPLATCRAMRWLELPAESAWWGALLSCLVSANATYGIEMESFSWSGWGLYAQAVALPLLPLAVAGGWRALETGERSRRTLGYAALLAAALMGHVLYGYIAAISLAIAPFVAWRPDEIGRRLMRLVRFLAQSGALVAFFVVPLALHLTYHAKSLYDEVSKFDSHGARVILERLFSGNLLDHGRLPALTLLAAAGLYLCARKWLEERSALHGWIGCGFVLWTLLYFGRATWGSLMNLLPLSRGLHLERLSSGVHLFAILMGGIAMGSLARWCLGFESRSLRIGLASSLFAALLLPMLAERVGYLVHNARLVAAANARFEKEKKDFEPILQRLRAEPGRVYAGHSGNWGRDDTVGDVRVYHLLSAEAIDDIGNAPFTWPLPTDFQLQFNPTEKASYDLYDTRYLLTDQKTLVPPGGELLVRSGKHLLYRVPSEGAFSLVSVPLAVSGDKESTWYMTMSWVKGLWSRQKAHARLLFRGESPGGVPLVRMVDQFRFVQGGSLPADPVSIFDPPGLFMSHQPPPAIGSLRNSKLTRERGSVTADLKEPGIVLFKTTYHPSWKATIDGVSVQTLVLTPGLIGIPVPAGMHEVRVAYSPGWGKGVLLAAGLLAAFLLDGVEPRGRKPRFARVLRPEPRPA